MDKTIQNQDTEQAPYQLKSTQEWFASIITHPLGKKDTIRSRTPHGNLIAEEAAQYVVPSPKLQPHQRMQIYNQQYWWRLLNTLHANFPLVTRLFGTHAFNEKIGIPYLLKYPPNHWSLHVLGKRLPKWIIECYKDRDRSLVLNAANLDWAFMDSLISPRYPFLDLAQILKENPEGLLSQTFYLQPYITLFNWEYDLLNFRGNFLKQGSDYWIEHRFPPLPKEKSYFFILYRNMNNHLAWREISQGEFTLLQRFKLGSSMIEACDYIESQEVNLYDFVAENLQKWLQDWIQAGWLTLNSYQDSDHELGV